MFLNCYTIAAIEPGAAEYWACTGETNFAAQNLVFLGTGKK